MNFISKYCKLYKQSSPNQMGWKIQTSNWRLPLRFISRIANYISNVFPIFQSNEMKRQIISWRLKFVIVRIFHLFMYKQLLITKCSSAIKLVTAQLLKGVSCERIAPKETQKCLNICIFFFHAARRWLAAKNRGIHFKIEKWIRAESLKHLVYVL